MGDLRDGRDGQGEAGIKLWFCDGFGVGGFWVLWLVVGLWVGG